MLLSLQKRGLLPEVWSFLFDVVERDSGLLWYCVQFIVFIGFLPSESIDVYTTCRYPGCSMILSSRKFTFSVPVEGRIGPGDKISLQCIDVFDQQLKAAAFLPE